MKPVDVVIKKPLYGTYVYIRDKYVDMAIKHRTMLRISIPQGTALVDPKEWKKNGKRMEKVFRNPNEPMVLYGGHVPLKLEDKLPKVYDSNKPKPTEQPKLF